MKSQRLTLALAAIAVAMPLAGCAGFNDLKACSNGQCVTVAPGSQGASSARQPAPSTVSPTTVTAPPETVTAPTVTATVTATPTTESAVQNCLPVPSEETLRRLANDATYDATIANCLNVPDPEVLATQLQQSAIIAYETGQGNTQAGVQVWVASDAPVQCPNGQQVDSVTSLYHQDR